MGLQKRKGSKYLQICFQYEGIPYSFSSKTTDPILAAEREIEHRQRVVQEHAARKVSGPSVTFNQAMSAYYLVKIEGAPKDHKTAKEIEDFNLKGWDALAIVGRVVGLETLCADVDTTRMIEIADYLANEPANTKSGVRKGSSVNKQTQLIFAVLNFAKDHMATPLPNRPRMREVKRPEDERDRIIDYDDEEAICVHLDKTLQSAFALELETAIRRGDVIKLKWSSVTLHDGSDGTYGFIRAHRKSRGKKLYPVPLNRRAAQIFRQLQGTDPEYVFTREVATSSIVGGKLTIVTTRIPYKKSHFSNSFKRAFVKAKMDDLTFHDLRRTAGTRYYLSTKDYELTRQFLGHSTVDVTKRYIKLALEAVAEGARNMERTRAGRGLKICHSACNIDPLSRGIGVQN